MADMPDLLNHVSFNQKGENDAPMEAGLPIMTIATGSEKPGTAAPETATTSGKGEKPEIEAEPPSNTCVEGLEKDSMDGECPKKIDADQQGLSAVGRELKEEASPEALRQSEEEQKQSKANSLLKRDSQDTVDDTFAPQAKKPKLFKTQDMDQEM